jgi:hypothetical protein
MYAAQNAFPDKVFAAQTHSVSLAFAVTDFKLQGRTLPRLILSIGTDRGGLAMRLSKLYVLISRVQAASGLRMLPGVPNGDWARVLKKLTLLLPEIDLLTWEGGYDENGHWSDKRALAAREAVDAKLDSAHKAADRTKARDRALQRKAPGHGSRPPPQGAKAGAPTVTVCRGGPAASAAKRVYANAEDFSKATGDGDAEKSSQGSSSSGSSSSSDCLSPQSLPMPSALA